VINRVVGGFVVENQLGEYFGDGLRITNDSAGVSNVPDGTFISVESFETKRVHWVNDLYTELDGSPDLVLEVVSDSSEDKDTEWLMTAYWNAGIREYWVIDARSSPLRFDIHKRGAKGFTTVRKLEGWSKSPVLGKSFRLRAIKNALGHPDFSLELR